MLGSILACAGRRGPQPCSPSGVKTVCGQAELSGVQLLTTASCTHPTSLLASASLFPHARCFAVLSHFSCVSFVILWTLAQQAPLSMRCSRQEYWSGLPCPPPGPLPDPGIKPVSCVSCMAGLFSTTEPPGKPPSSRNFGFPSSFLGCCVNHREPDSELLPHLASLQVLSCVPWGSASFTPSCHVLSPSGLWNPMFSTPSSPLLPCPPDSQT